VISGAGFGFRAISGPNTLQTDNLEIWKS